MVTPSSQRQLELALWADTAFLSGLAIMDYSLLVGVKCVLAEAAAWQWDEYPTISISNMFQHASDACDVSAGMYPAQLTPGRPALSFP